MNNCIDCKYFVRRGKDNDYFTLCKYQNEKGISAIRMRMTNFGCGKEGKYFEEKKEGTNHGL